MATANTIHVDIVSAEGEIFSGEATMVFAPGDRGRARHRAAARAAADRCSSPAKCACRRRPAKSSCSASAAAASKSSRTRSRCWPTPRCAPRTWTKPRRCGEAARRRSAEGSRRGGRSGRGAGGTGQCGGAVEGDREAEEAQKRRLGSPRSLAGECASIPSSSFSVGIRPSGVSLSIASGSEVARPASRLFLRHAGLRHEPLNALRAQGRAPSRRLKSARFGPVDTQLSAAVFGLS